MQGALGLLLVIAFMSAACKPTKDSSSEQPANGAATPSVTPGPSGGTGGISTGAGGPPITIGGGTGVGGAGMTGTPVPGSICGNGVIESGEQCEDGNKVDDDFCTSKCQTPKCGDQVVQRIIGEHCDDGQNNGAPGSNCTVGCLDLRILSALQPTPTPVRPPPLTAPLQISCQVYANGSSEGYCNLSCPIGSRIVAQTAAPQRFYGQNGQVYTTCSFRNIYNGSPSAQCVTSPAYVLGQLVCICMMTCGP